MATNYNGITHFFTKLQFVTHHNWNGISRQDAIRRCRRGQLLEFYLDDNNRFDRNAVAVREPFGDILGYVSPELATEIRSYWYRGYDLIPVVADITGGGYRQNVGLNIAVVRAAPGVAREQVHRYANSCVPPDGAPSY